MAALCAILVTLGAQVDGSTASPGAAVPAFRVAIPAPATLRIVDFPLVAKPGVRLPARIGFRVPNRAQLAKTIDAAVVVVQSSKRRLDVFVIVLRRSAAAKSSQPAAAAAEDFVDVLTSGPFIGFFRPVGSSEPSLSLPMHDFVAKEIAKEIVTADHSRGIEALRKALETSPAEVESLVGLVDPDPFVKEITKLVATIDQTPVTLPKLDQQAQLDQIVREIEQTIKDDLNGDGAIGAPVEPPAGPTLYRYSIPAFDVSFTGPAANGSPAVTDTFSAGTGCGDPATNGWAISTTTTGIAVTPTNNVANFSRQNPFTVLSHSFSFNKTATGAIQIAVHYLPGTPATITVETSTTGDITQVSVPTSPLPVTLTAVTTC
jgi:hypothetical protein